MSSESVQPDIEPRTIRAATEHMTVIEEARSLFSVTTQSGSEYTVDLREPACTCPDFQHRESVSECKHVRRVRLEVGQIDVEGLAAELERTASELLQSAAQLESKAEDIYEQASELEDTRDRLMGVAGHE
jgi:predicted nucleic acid-binding Zn finger protein